MKKNKPKIVIILGPTASGKTKLAVSLADRFNGEIISADSRQVYKYMNIGTGKDLHDYKIGKKRIKYHLIDVVNPQNQYSVAKWLKATNLTIKDIEKQGKLPIICGGTGLYISALVDGLVQLPENPIQAKHVRTKLEKYSLPKLLKILQKIDITTFHEIDHNNRRRVQRALEIFYITGKKKSELYKVKNNNYQFLQIGVSLNKNILHKKIDDRLNKRFKQGMIREISVLKKRGVSWKHLESFGLEYKWLGRFSRKKITEQELIAGLSHDIKQFAKRQMTWFNRDKEIIWLKNYKQTEKLVNKFLK